MTLPPTIISMRKFLGLVLEDEAPSLEQLAHTLDELAMAYYTAPDASPSASAATPPDGDYVQLRQCISARFPSLGFYPIMDPLTDLRQPVMMGDALDDLTDITHDMQAACWRYEKLGADDAYWWFRFSYQTHWGRHLRELSLYLHAKQFG